MAPRKKPVPAPIAVAPSARPSRPLASAVARRGLPTVAALLSACAALACSEAPSFEVRADQEGSQLHGLGTSKVAPPNPTEGLPGFGGGDFEPSPNPPVVKGEMPAVKPKPVPTHVMVPGGIRAPVVGSVKPFKPAPIPPTKKAPKLGGDIPAVDPSI